MKKGKLLYLIPMAAIVLSGCTAKEGAESTQNWLNNNIVYPIRDFFRNLFGKNKNKDDKPSPEPVQHVHSSNRYESDEIYHWKICDECSEQFAKGEHQFGEWEVVNESTIFDEGIKTRKCSVCDFVESEVVPQLSSNDTFIQYDDKVYFGNYPQDLVTDEELIAGLSQGVEIPSEEDEKDWNVYNFYWNDAPRKYGFYRDVDINDDGQNDYRGIYFTGYRSNYTDKGPDDASYQRDHGIELNKIHWFKYSPILWDIFRTNEDDTLTLASYKLLDTQSFYKLNHNSEPFEHNGGAGLVNNYALSDIRLFLNNEFLEDAFSKKSQSLIQNKVIIDEFFDVNNEPISINDKVYLLSKDDVQEAHETHRSTQYAHYLNAEDYVINNRDRNTYWLRTEGTVHNMTTVIDFNGNILDNNTRVFKTTVGDRPVVDFKFPGNIGEIEVTNANPNRGQVSSSKAVAPVGDKVKFLALANQAYKFEGWYVNDIKISEDEVLEIEVKQDKINVVAKFIPFGDVDYTVRHYLKEVGLDDYVEDENARQTLGGLAESLTEAVAKDYEGFTAKEIEQKEIKPDGSTVVDIYYDRNFYNFTFDYGAGGYAEGPEDGLIEFGDSIQCSASISQGYHFDGWYINDEKVNDQLNYSFTMPANDVDLECRFSPNTNTPYTVECWCDSVWGNYHSYLKGHDFTLYGTTGTQATCDNPPEIDGYHFDSVETEENLIKGNGSTCLRIYYLHDRYLLTTTADENLGSTYIDITDKPASAEIRHEEQVTVVAVPKDASWKFEGWYENNQLVSQERRYKFTMERQPRTLEARFEENWVEYGVYDMFEEWSEINGYFIHSGKRRDETYIGRGGSLTDAQPIERAGYHVVNIENKVISANGGTDAVITYDLNEVTLRGTINDRSVAEFYLYGDVDFVDRKAKVTRSIWLMEVQYKAGVDPESYYFAGWFKKDTTELLSTDMNLEYVIQETDPELIEVEARFLPNNVGYYVRYHYQNLNDLSTYDSNNSTDLVLLNGVAKTQTNVAENALEHTKEYYQLKEPVVEKTLAKDYEADPDNPLFDIYFDIENYYTVENYVPVHGSYELGSTYRVLAHTGETVTVVPDAPDGYYYDNAYNESLGHYLSQEVKEGMTTVFKLYFSQDEYKVVPEVDPSCSGMGSVSTTQSHVWPNDEVTITATPAEHHRFIGWYNGENLVSTEAQYTFIMPVLEGGDGAELHLTAKFEELETYIVAMPTWATNDNAVLTAWVWGDNEDAHWVYLSPYVHGDYLYAELDLGKNINGFKILRLDPNIAPENGSTVYPDGLDSQAWNFTGDIETSWLKENNYKVFIWQD